MDSKYQKEIKKTEASSHYGIYSHFNRKKSLTQSVKLFRKEDEAIDFAKTIICGFPIDFIAVHNGIGDIVWSADEPKIKRLRAIAHSRGVDKEVLK